MVFVTTIKNSHETIMMLPRTTQRSALNPVAELMSFQSESTAPTTYKSAGIAISPRVFFAANHRKITIRTRPPNIRHHPTKASVSTVFPSMSACGFMILGTKRACSMVTRRNTANAAAVASAKIDARIGNHEPGETRSFFFIISTPPFRNEVI